MFVSPLANQFQLEFNKEKIIVINIPENLTKHNQWVCWMAVPKENGKTDKKPINPSNGSYASVTDRNTWGSFDQAVSRYKKSKGLLAGVGFVLTDEDPVCGIDLDNCRDLETGKIEDWASEIVSVINSYSEVSPSGKGLRIFAEGKIPPGGNRKGPVELYSSARYLTVTGQHLSGTPLGIEYREQEISRVHGSIFDKREEHEEEASATPACSLSDNELLEKAMSADNGEKFEKLWNGDWEQLSYSSESEADLALCNILAFWTGRDSERIDRLFRQSGMFRKKWDEERGNSTWGQMTVRQAIENTKEVYKGVNKRNDVKSCIKEAYPYVVEDGVIFYRKNTRNGEMFVPLNNYDAWIVGEITRDDGAEKSTVLKIIGALEDGTPLPEVDVPADKFATMNWILMNWGTSAIVNAGFSNKEHLRVAIQKLSDNVTRYTIYEHVGWRRIKGEWVYLHAGGAIGQNGETEGIQVSLNKLDDYNLPAPPEGEDLKDAIRASLEFLRLAPEDITMPLLAAVYRAPLGQASTLDLSVFLSGITGSQKTELSAMAQAHFGQNFHGRNLPGNWSSSANSLEKQAFLIKDAVFVVDDFCPVGTTSDIQRYHKEADRLLRGQANKSGRGRMNPDGSLKTTYYPRGLVISTGEDIPKGHSLRARMLILEVAPRTVNLGALTTIQSHASKGLLAASMSGFVKWLAPQLDDVIANFSRLVTETRNELIARGMDRSHDRLPDMLASLLVGFRYFLDFAEEKGVIYEIQAKELLSSCKKALLQASNSQGEIQADEESTARFLKLLSAALASGKAHLTSVDNRTPRLAEYYGWRDNDYGLQPMGDKIGWIDSDDAYLIPDVAFTVAQKLGGSQGAPLTVTQRTLWKRMQEKGLLASRETSKSNTVRKVVGGTRKHVIHIQSSLLVNLVSNVTNQVV